MWYCPSRATVLARSVEIGVEDGLVELVRVPRLPPAADRQGVGRGRSRLQPLPGHPQADDVEAERGDERGVGGREVPGLPGRGVELVGGELVDGVHAVEEHDATLLVIEEWAAGGTDGPLHRRGDERSGRHLGDGREVWQGRRRGRTTGPGHTGHTGHGRHHAHNCCEESDRQGADVDRRSAVSDPGGVLAPESVLSASSVPSALPVLSTERPVPAARPARISLAS